MILHLDADAFFASCEQAMNPALQGKPIVTGKERGIAAAFSYEAKALGITRGMPVFYIKKHFPEVIIVSGDYRSYAMFSHRIFDIVRQYTNMVEVYGADEGFVDLYSSEKYLNMSAYETAKTIQSHIKQELNIPVSIGVAPTKVLAKIASRWNKPFGVCEISQKRINECLEILPISYVWGIGRQLSKKLEAMRIQTAKQFIDQPIGWVKAHFSRPVQDLWRELRGESIFPVNPKRKREYKSITKSRTFSPRSSKTKIIWPQLTKNLENACIKARTFDLVAKEITVWLRAQDRTIHSARAKLSRASAYPIDMMNTVRTLYRQAKKQHVQYRSTGITLQALQPRSEIQSSLFEPSENIRKMKSIYKTVDTISEKFGRNTIHLGSSLAAQRYRKGDLLLRSGTKSRASQDSSWRNARRKKIATRNSRLTLSIPFLE